jgi:hypothetical protein
MRRQRFAYLESRVDVLRRQISACVRAAGAGRAGGRSVGRTFSSAASVARSAAAKRAKGSGRPLFDLAEKASKGKKAAPKRKK